MARFAAFLLAGLMRLKPSKSSFCAISARVEIASASALDSVTVMMSLLWLCAMYVANLGVLFIVVLARLDVPFFVLIYDGLNDPVPHSEVGHNGAICFANGVAAIAANYHFVFMDRITPDRAGDADVKPLKDSALDPVRFQVFKTWPHLGVPSMRV